MGVRVQPHGEHRARRRSPLDQAVGPGVGPGGTRARRAESARRVVAGADPVGLAQDPEDLEELREDSVADPDKAHHPRARSVQADSRFSDRRRPLVPVNFAGSSFRAENPINGQSCQRIVPIFNTMESVAELPHPRFGRISRGDLGNDGRILIADDQADVLEALRLLLKGEGFGIESANSPAGIMAALETSDFDVVLMDLNYTRDTTSGQEGLDLLSRIQANDPSTTVVVMTAWGSVDLAVEAMRRGARDFVQKPWDNARLLAILRTQVELSNALKRGQRLEAENRLLRTDGGPALIAESPAMQPVLQLIARVGPSDANVLITGEAGTGKEVVARTLHAVSARAIAPDGDGQRRRPGGRRVRKRAVRPRARSLHRRQDGSRGPLRAGGQRHAVSG